ncbi:hypothetical protein KKC87_04570 [Patescibacteria group bacterium]|nr:hypothetical protein [Patescibacteria group bacterium]
MKEKLFGNIHELTDDEKRVERLEKKLFIMKYGTISFVFIFCMLLSLSSFTMAHEQVHVQICQNGGGHAEVTYTPLFLGGYTI